MIYPLSFPQTVTTERLTLDRRQSVSESPWTLSQQVVNTASQWQLEWTWPRMRHAEAELVRAWLVSLRGQVGTFQYSPRQSVSSTLTNRTLGQPAYAYGDTIVVGGWDAGGASQLRVGQIFQLGNQLLLITSASTNALPNGQVTITFEPQLRANVSAGTAVEFISPKGTFRLATAGGAGFAIDPDRAPDFGSMTAREAI